LIITGLTNTFLITGLCLAAIGLSFMMFSTTVNTTLQINTSDEFRGRVMSVYTLVFGGLTPIGSFFSGVITEHFGARAGYFACGIAIAVLLVMVYVVKGNGLKSKIMKLILE
jgi:MFS family permease